VKTLDVVGKLYGAFLHEYECIFYNSRILMLNMILSI
jgi:hypothetical protein